MAHASDSRLLAVAVLLGLALNAVPGLWWSWSSYGCAYLYYEPTGYGEDGVDGCEECSSMALMRSMNSVTSSRFAGGSADS